jgi:hypothetical protein
LYQRAAAAVSNLPNPQPCHWADEHRFWFYGHPLRHRNDNFGHQIPCDYRGYDPVHMVLFCYTHTHTHTHPDTHGARHAYMTWTFSSASVTSASSSARDCGTTHKSCQYQTKSCVAWIVPRPGS